MRPSFSTRAFQSAKLESSSESSCPRCASRTGCAESALTRYWYQESSQAIVITASEFGPESGITLARAWPRLLEMPLTVRRKVEALNRSAASTTASSSRERRRRIGSSATGGDSLLARSKIAERLSLRRRWSGGGVGAVGVPLLRPALLERALLAQRTHVDVAQTVRREAHRPFADEKRALADGAVDGGLDAQAPHDASPRAPAFRPVTSDGRTGKAGTA
jgi:hypothetical protein